ncbi:hypothetical protein DM02DRAFT_609612 [Periconia macrospinosa]|uniref:Uncharacterized protein n=1 Tax=Periconia macrospinosa TaxID=97972 RepID=A0A2V1E9H7_9PLEO|nr:hypothetical protein DM02DRAFT_609612 [Periconia macrospinosa]
MIKDRTEREKQEDLQKWAHGWKGRQKAHRKAFKPVHEEFSSLIGSMRRDPSWRRRFGDE